MFIKQTRKKLKGKTYSNYLLVESVATPRGPRHRVVCSLGSLAPAPREHWLRLAHNLQDSLSGQGSLLAAKSAREQAIASKLAAAPHGAKATRRAVEFDTEALEVEQAVKPAPCMWAIRSGSGLAWKRYSQKQGSRTKRAC